MTLLQNNKVSRRIYPGHAIYAFYELIWALWLVMVCLCGAIALIRHY